MAKKKKKKSSKWIDTSAFKDGYDFGDVTKTITRSAKKSTKQAKKVVSKKTNSIAEDTMEFISSNAAKKIVAGTASIGALGELFESKIGDPAKEAGSNFVSALKNFGDDDNGYTAKGLLDDGYNIGDITRSIIGTGTDLIKTGQSEIGRKSERVIDMLATGAAGVAKSYGNDNLYDKTIKFIERDLDNELKLGRRIIDNLIPGNNSLAYTNQLVDVVNQAVNKGDHKNASFIGPKGESLVRSGTNLAADAALASVGVPWQLSTGITAFGSGVEEAFRGDATYGEAVSHGSIEAGKEILLNKLFRGFKFEGKALTEAVQNNLADKISNKTARTLANLGMDMAGEGAEEALQQVVSNLSKKLTYEDEKTWEELMYSEEAMDGYIESFISGAVVSGGFNAKRASDSIKTGRDYNTGLTESEQKVIDREVESRVNEKVNKATESRKKAKLDEEINKAIEKEKDKYTNVSEERIAELREEVRNSFDSSEIDLSDIKVSGKERNAIEKRVLEDLKRGEIDTFTIEDTLFRDSALRMKELDKELETATPERKTEIEAELNQLTESFNSELDKNGLLKESYKQKALAREALNYKVDKDASEKKKKVVQSAIEAGANNTRRTHERVDLAAKIAEDADLDITFVNEEQLENLGYYEDVSELIQKRREAKTDAEKKEFQQQIEKIRADRGKNGTLKNGVAIEGQRKVLLNIDSQRALEFSLGHEITHHTEKTEGYDKLRQFVKEYAESKDEYKQRFDSVDLLYSNYTKDKDLDSKTKYIEQEVTADLVGEYIFTDEDFVKNLSVKEPNIFQKAYDYIKHVYKMATAGSAEARQLEQAKRMFDKAYKEISKATTQEVKDNSLTEADSNTAEMYEGRDLSKDKELYNYDFLTSLPPMKKTKLPEISEITNEKGKVDRNVILEQGRNNAGEVGTIDGDHFKIRNKYTGRDITITNTTIKHGLNGDNKRLVTNGRIAAVAGEAIQNAVPVNALYDTAPNAVGTYAMAGIATEEGTNRRFVYIVTVEQHTDNVSSIETYDVGHSISGRIEKSSLADTKSPGLIPTETANISIEDFLKIVNNTHKSILSDDVLNALGEKKPANGYYTDKVKFSFSGENALNKNNEHLKRAKEMDEAGRPNEIIRRETGWHKGYDGKWRFEIDDSQMKVYKSGDALFRKSNPKYVRMQELYDKFFYGDISDNEMKELSKLEDFYGNEETRLRERLRNGTARLADILEHDVLFENYPMLASMNVRITKLDNGTRGQFNSNREEIVLDEDLFKDDYRKSQRDEVLIHEIQHAIQSIEKFARGSNSELFENGKIDLVNHIKGVQDNLDLFLKDIGYKDFVKQSVTELAKGDKTLDQHWRDLEDFKANSKYAKEIQSNEQQLKELREEYDKLYSTMNEGETPFSMYQRTAGEIEARDTADRLRLTEDERRLKAPMSRLENVERDNVLFSEDYRYSISEKGTMIDSKGNDVILQASDAGTHGTLMAIRNINEAELRGMLALGGIPNPSIAITNPSEVDFTDFGNISLLFDKETIDPANKKNEVYDRDVWSPRFPAVEYEADEKVSNKIRDKIYGLMNEVPSEFQTSLRSLVGDIGDRLNKEKGEAGLVSRYANDHDMKQAYLVDTGKKPIELIYNETRTEATEQEKQQNEFFINALGEEVINSTNVHKGKEWFDQYGDAARRAYSEYLQSEGIPAEDADSAVSSMKPFAILLEVRKARKYRENGGVEIKREADYPSTNNKIDESVNQQEYIAWLKDLFGGIEKSIGIYNGKDPFTPSGNRRSFKQLHDAYTLENVVKQMTKGRTQAGEGGVFGTSFGAISSNMATRFKSIEDIKKNEGQINADADEIIKPLKDEVESSVSKLTSFYKGDSWDAYSSALTAVLEFTEKKLTENNLRKALSDNYFDAAAVPSENLTDVINSLNKLKGITTDYFEAKPQRAVGLDEIQAIVIPNTTDIDLKRELSEAGFYVIEYDSNLEGDKQNKVNQFDNLKFSLSGQNEGIAPIGMNNQGVKVQTSDDIAPIRDDYRALNESDIPYVEQQGTDALNSITDDMAPVVTDDPVYEEDDFEPVDPLEADGRDIKDVGKRNVKAYMYENPEVKPFFQEEAAYMLNDLRNSVKGQKHFNDQLYYDSGGEQGWYGTKRETSEEIAYLLDKFNYSYADIEKGLNAIIEDHGAENNAISKRIEFMIDERLREGYEDMMYGDTVPPNEEYINLLREKQITEYSDEAYEAWVRSLADVEAPVEPITQGGIDYIRNLSREAGIDTADIVGRYGVGSLEEMNREQYMDAVKWLDQVAIAPVRVPEAPEPPVREAVEDIAPIRDDIPISQGVQQEMREDGTTGDVPEDIPKKTRRDLQRELLVGESNFIIKALEKAKNIPMALMNNTDTIRNTEMVFGREAGKKINEAIFQKAIDNEARSIYWQNKQRADLKALGIKARSKESAAVQKYGEGEYINEFGDLVEYGDGALMVEFPDEATQEKIKEAARIIKAKYERYIDQANEVLTGLGFDPIPKRKDYMRHFQELNDVFSRNGIPFNPQNMKEHVLPTDINGLTEFWSPQKNYFANMQPRKGKRTTLDAITGIDGYISGIANLIFHTEDIQRGRAFEGMIRENFGEERGWDILETLPQEDQLPRAELIQNNHLSNYAAWVHEWTNNIAGKKNKIDRSVEAMFGRKGFAFLDGVRKQVGANMIGFNIASSLTNLIAPIQAISKTSKTAVMKGSVDTFRNIISKDDFVDKNPFLTSRFGTDMLSKTKWEKMQDAGYVFMKGVDHFSSNLIVRSKYNELIKKGMSEKEAHKEAGRFAARIMGDRTKGANAQLYNSKMVGVLTQFQLEVNNQLYSMFYDTYHDSKENAKGNAAKMAAGMTFTLGQLFAFTHIFGKGFETLAGYNPTFDVLGIIATLFGIGGDEEEEKTFSERSEAAVQQLIKSLPYTSVFTGGRIPIGQALPIKQLFTGEDQYGNEKSRWETLAETAPYYAMPAGYGQIKKTAGGVEMFIGDKPVSGSYTDSGNLRFPVEETPANVVHAAIFGKWANKNAQDYIDNERAPLKEKQIQEYKDLDMPIKEYWDIREGLAEQKTLEDKFDYIADLDIPVRKKNIMINNIVDREDRVDLGNYGDFSGYEEFDFATKYPEKYSMSKVVGFDDYQTYTDDLWNIRADKDSNGNSIRGSRQEKVIDYINSLDIDYEAKLILYKKEYNSDDAHNQEIIDYLNNRDDISYQDMESILKELGFEVASDGTIYW